MNPLTLGIVLIVTATIIVFNYEKILGFFSKLSKKLLIIHTLIVSTAILIINYRKTVEFRNATPSWEYYHDPFWFTFLIHSHTLTNLFLGFILSILLTIVLMKVDISLKKLS
ncbi:hypothetical protein DS745_23155 [Anaerobacillus alkaliphilus]|uniref:Uncharacterized protein n=1 Tax=Anaerobacillus alkaliphilus TaxID=1548597 RepID=A0A4Q0VMN5_9BACI|nr:hypothetical protein [Anaerobacillus alkaliphilus]RXI96601.1 hypothetical protein DS745_23155 [Anaerobacillus alkaliphilus]